MLDARRLVTALSEIRGAKPHYKEFGDERLPRYNETYDNMCKKTQLAGKSGQKGSRSMDDKDLDNMRNQPEFDTGTPCGRAMNTAINVIVGFGLRPYDFFKRKVYRRD